MRFHSIKVSMGDFGSLDLSSILGGTTFLIFIIRLQTNFQRFFIFIFISKISLVMARVLSINVQGVCLF